MRDPNIIRNLAREVEAAAALQANRDAKTRFNGAEPGDVLHIQSRLPGGNEFQAVVTKEVIQGDLGGYEAKLTTGQQKNTIVFVGYHDIIRIEKKLPDKEVYV